MLFAIRRAALFFGLWLILLPSLHWYDLLIGLLFTLMATISSMTLLPPSATRLKLWPLVLYLPRFVQQSVLAGWDIAKRVFRAQMQLAPGLVQHRTRLEAGMARNSFSTLTSLTPGTLPCGSTDTSIIYHALDHRQDHLGALQQEERRFDNLLNDGGHQA